MKNITCSKFLLSLTVMLLFCISVCRAQTSTSLHQYDEMSEYYDDGLKRVCAQGKYGFIDFEGNEVIPLKYEDAFNFRNGFAPVKLNGKWSYINLEGKEITQFIYDEALNFQEDIDVAAVIIGDYYGFIDKSGKEITTLKYEVQNRSCVSEVSGYKWITLNKNERYNDFQSITKKLFTLKHPFMNEKTGNAYHPRFLEFYDDHIFHEGLAAVSVKCPEYGRLVPKRVSNPGNRGYTVTYEIDETQPAPICWGFIDITGKEIIPLKYKTISPFGVCSKEHHCWVIQARIHNEYNNLLYLDILGNEYLVGHESEKNIINTRKAANKAMIELEKVSDSKPSILETGKK